MASLKNILNPERKKSVKLVVLPPEPPPPVPWEVPISHPSPGSSSEDDLDDYNPLEHIPHPDCPDSLACLPDTDGRPQHTLPVILRCAILGSPRKRLTIREIYAAMEEKYAYYRTAGPTWKQSVRHHLSLNRLFERQPRPATDPGFGSYWTVNLNAPPGTKRPRKRGRPNKDGQPRARKDLLPAVPPVSATVANLTGAILPVPEEASSSKPRRGRPRKEDSPVPIAIDDDSLLPIEGQIVEPPIEPPIEQVIEPPIESAEPADIDVEVDDEDEDEEVDMLAYEDEAIDELESHPSEQEDECESEEKLLHPFERRHSLSGGLTPYDSSAGLHISPNAPSHVSSPHMTSPHLMPSPHLIPSPHLASSPHISLDGSNPEDIIDRLQMEMAHLRRQSADAISLSMRLSDQLAQAEAERHKAQLALEATEMKLREETTRRRQAEREADDAVRLRHAAEEALKATQYQSNLPRLAR